MKYPVVWGIQATKCLNMPLSPDSDIIYRGTRSILQKNFLIYSAPRQSYGKFTLFEENLKKQKNFFNQPRLPDTI